LQCHFKTGAAAKALRVSPLIDLIVKLTPFPSILKILEIQRTYVTYLSETGGLTTHFIYFWYYSAVTINYFCHREQSVSIQMDCFGLSTKLAMTGS